jgi:hypothetical protein
VKWCSRGDDPGVFFEFATETQVHLSMANANVLPLVNLKNW